MTQMALETNFRLTWLLSIENTLNECGLSFIWTYQTFYDANWLKRIVKITLEDQFTQTWFSSVEASAKTLNYRLFKESLKTEKYFDVLNDKDGFTFCKFRMVNHKLPIECGRWSNIPRKNRTCPLCENGDIGDEYHYLLKCNFFTTERNKYLDKIIHKPL